MMSFSSLFSAQENEAARVLFCEDRTLCVEEDAAWLAAPTETSSAPHRSKVYCCDFLKITTDMSVY